MTTNFKNQIEKIDPTLLRLGELKILQVNLGDVCNLQCKHCHVGAGPAGTNIMTVAVMERILAFLGERSGLCLDITGGCPELNENFRFLVESASGLVDRIMVRTNLTVFFEDGLGWIPEWYRDHKVTVIGSLPCYTEENVDTQRGSGVFSKSIEAIRLLNGLGYGRDQGLELNLVYNPGGDFLPASQQGLESDYKRRLYEDHGLVFSRLFTITNAPIGRFRHYLEANGELEKYFELLADSFNPDIVGGIMCRGLVSIDYRGIAYNCDFNQAMNMPIVDSCGNIVTIDTLEEDLAGSIEIITGTHCYCCTAGVGSSCTGALLK